MAITFTEEDLLVDIVSEISTTQFDIAGQNTITASAKPTISSAVKTKDTTLTGWTTTVNAGDILAFNVDSVSTVQRLTIALTGKKN